MRRKFGKVGYVLAQFPLLSQTFVLNEVLELERQGMALQIFSLFDPTGEPTHAILKKVQTPVLYLIEDPLTGWRIREGRFAEGSFQERPLKELFRGEKPPKALVSPSILSGLVNRLARRVRAIEDLPVFAAQLKAVPQAAAVAALAKQKGVGHLHAHFGGYSTTVAMVAGGLSGLSYSFSAHAGDIYRGTVNRTLLKEKIRRARFVVACTEYNRGVVEALGGETAKKKILRVYHGVDFTRVRPNLAIPRKPNLILGVGRLVEKKGFLDLLRACRFLQDKGHTFRCTIVGEGEERDRLIQQISALGIQDRVVLIGARPLEQVLNMMKEATVLVLPCVVSESGDQDGLPNVLVEALAVGLPAISTTLSGIPELIEHGKTGLLVSPGDSKALASAIKQILGNHDLRDRLARNGLEKVRRNFNIRKNVEVIRGRFARSVRASA
jgi:glycosyltransferase involved in cell wall biosynthesis